MALSPFQHRSDRTVTLTVFGLVLFGLVMVYSASIIIASLPPYSDDTYFVKRQIVAAVIGFVAMLVAANVDYHVWKKWAGWMLGITLVLLVSVFFFSNGEILGAHRWITIAGQTFQPSELAKLTFILYASAWLTERREEIGSIRRTFLPFIVVVTIISLLMLKEPDFGTLTIILAPALLIFYVAGMTWKQGLLLLGTAILAGALVFSTPYRRARITTFLNPSEDQSGSSYHIKNISIAIGSGGWKGLGFGNSKQKRLFLPEPYTDSIFAIISEELGSVRATFLILVFCFLIYRGFRIASLTQDMFGRLIAVGITGWFAFQTFVNLGSMLHLVPLVGVPLPFISYGGSNLIISLLAVGVLLNISKFTTIPEQPSTGKPKRRP